MYIGGNADTIADDELRQFRKARENWLDVAPVEIRTVYDVVVHCCYP